VCGVSSSMQSWADPRDLPSHVETVLTLPGGRWRAPHARVLVHAACRCNAGPRTRRRRANLRSPGPSRFRPHLETGSGQCGFRRHWRDTHAPCAEGASAAVAGSPGALGRRTWRAGWGLHERAADRALFAGSLDRLHDHADGAFFDLRWIATRTPVSCCIGHGLHLPSKRWSLHDSQGGSLSQGDRVPPTNKGGTYKLVTPTKKK
jgi:hypothetical protein